MLIYVLNKDLDIVDMVESTKSIIWTNRYFEAGDCEILAPATDKYLNILVDDNILIRDGHLENAMIIKGVQINTDAEVGNTILAKGYCLKSILKRRIIWNQTNLNGNIEDCIYRLLNENIINPSDPTRKISNFTFEYNGSFTDEIRVQYTGDNLYDVIVALCQKFGIGFDVLLDLDNKKYIFKLYSGTDRSYNQTDNPYVTFSNEFENLLTTMYTTDSSNYKNVAKVAGEGEGILRKYTTVGTAEGMNRYELYIDSRNSSSNEGEITDDEYMLMLQEEGSEELTNHKIIENYEGEVETGLNYIINEDYFLGDIVAVVNEYNMEANARIIEVIESEDESGTHTIPTFSALF